MIPPASPERYHEKSHAAVPFEQCWRCGKAKAICKSKIRFATLAEAIEWVTDFNETHGYASPVVRYPCRWCEGWHMTTAARSKHKARRAERERRKWLISRRTS